MRARFSGYGSVSWAGSLLGLWLATVVAEPTAGATTQINVESVDDYTLRNGPSLNYSVANGSGFMSNMTQAGSIFTVGQEWRNPQVIDTDFHDKERSGRSADTDYLYFDTTSTAMAYFTGHGFNQACVDNVWCSSSSQCNSPPSGAWGPGACRQAPDSQGNPLQWCCYGSPRTLRTSSPYDSYSGIVNYSSGHVAWGESTTFGNWAGAGTNGGANLVVLDISHGVTAMFAWSELSPMFAGARLVAVIQPILGDTRNIATRGSTLASKYLVNPSGSVGAAWGDTLNSLGAQDGSSCGKSDYSQGGGHGINGCGCNFIMAVDESQYWADQDLNHQNWSQYTNDAYDSSGNAYYMWSATCNYNSAMYQWGLP